MRISLALIAVMSGLALTSAAAGMPAKKGPAKKPFCTGTVTGRVAGDLVVPQGATCNASGAVVERRVRVLRGATLTASGSFSAGRGIDAARGATLQLIGTQIAVGGRVEAHGAKRVALIREPVAGSNGTIAGSVLLYNTADVSVLSLTIGGMVLVRGGGAEGVEVGASRILGSLEVTRARMLHPTHPRVFSIHSNVVSRHLHVSNNNARGAIEPLFIGGNRLLRGNLTCRANIPAPVNSGPGGTEPNIVLHGRKRGQCASL